MSFARSRSFLFLLFAVFAGASGILRAAIVVDGTPVFAAAQAGRTHMDRNTAANAWTGTAFSNQGDRFRITLKNTDEVNAVSNVALSVALPENFARVGNATAAGSNVSPTTITGGFRFPARTIAANASVTYEFGLRTTSTAGTHSLTYTWTGGGSATHDVLIKAGAYVIEASPAKLSLQVNESGTYEYTLTNTGLGGLFNIRFDEAGNLGATGPSPTSWRFDSFGPRVIANSPGTTANTSGTTVSINYLAPGGSVKIPVNGTVQDCLDIRNVYAVVHNLAEGSQGTSGSTPIELDLTKPLISYTPGDIQLKYGAPVTVTVPLENTGNGTATSVTVATNFYAMGVTITPGAGWTYDAVTGVFTLTANSGRIDNGAIRNLVFSIVATDACAEGAGGERFVMTSLYTDLCGNAYTLPTKLAGILPPDDAPSLEVLRDLAVPEVRVSQPGSYVIRVNVGQPAKFVSPAALIVTDTLPAELTPTLPLVPSVGTATYDEGTRGITWTIPVASLGTAQALPIAFSVAADGCLAGETRPGTVSTNTLLTSAGCEFRDDDSATFYLSSPGIGGSGTITPGLTVGTPAAGESFETGTADNDGVRQLGEGEFISFEASYMIGTDYTQGLWSATVFADDFGGLSGARLVTGSLELSLDGGAWSPVPSGSVSVGPNSLAIQLSFLSGAGYYDGDSVSGATERTLKFRYKITATDADLNSTTRNSRIVTQRTNLVVGSANAACSTKFEKWVIYSIGRAGADVTLSMPDSIELCENFEALITVNAESTHAARNVRVSLLSEVAGGKYVYVNGSATYGGAFATGISETSTADGPVFSWNGELTEAESGIIRVTLRRRQAPAPAAFDTSVAPPLQVTLAYDDNQTAPAGNHVFSGSAEVAPAVVRSADIRLFATPQSVLVTDQNVSWTSYLTNAGNGTAYDTVYRITFPDGIVPVSAAAFATAINTANSGGVALSATDITVSGQLVAMQLGSVASGVQIKLPLSGTLDGTTCSFNGAAYTMVGEWGCNSTVIQTATVSNPAFVQPAGDVQVVHDTRSKAILCEESEIVIIVKNVGLPALRDLKIEELLSTSALTYVPGSTRYATNISGHNLASGATWTAALSEPVIAGSSLTWDKISLPALGKLVSSTSGSVTEPHTVYIRLLVRSSEAINVFTGSISANLVDGKLPCGSAMPASPGTAYTLPVEKPDITLVKTGRNLTAGDTAWSKTVYGGVNDVIEWRVQITNNGNFEARQVRLINNVGNPARGDMRSSLPAYAGGSGAANYTTNTVAYTDETELSLPPIPKAGDSGHVVTLYFLEKLAALCVADDDATASVTWGCTASTLLTPSDNNDATRLVMRGTYTVGDGDLSQSTTALSNGRIRQVIRLRNGGGTIKDLVLNLTLTNGLVIDTSVPPAITSTATPNTTKYDTLTLNNTTPAAPALTFGFTGATDPNPMRFGQAVEVTVYYLPAIVEDDKVNLANPTMAQATAYQMPETTANALDPAQPATASVTVTVNFRSTCDNADSATLTASNIATNVPDLDITVAPSPVQLIAAQAPYTYIFDYTVSNAGPAGSVASNSVFRLHAIGADWQAVSAKVLSSQGSGFATNTLTNTSGTIGLGQLNSGQSAIVRVIATTKPYDNVAGTPKAENLVLVGEVEGSLFNQAGTDTTINYSLDRAAAIVSDNFNVSGHLYVDANRNGFRDTVGAPETAAGISGVSGLHAKLIDTASPAVALAAVPLAANGAYVFENAAIPGTYLIIIDDNATLADITPIALAGYLGTEAPGLVREVVVGVTSVYNQNFGVWRGAKLAGVVFKDTGDGPGGIANDGMRNGSEAGIAGVAVTAASDNGATTHDTAVTAGDGSYSLWVPAGAAARIVATNTAGHLSTGAVAGDTGGTVITADVIAFSPVAGTSYSGIDFGDVPPNAFLTDGTQTILPGATATYPHTYIAGTAGSVKFAATVAASSPASVTTWSHVLYHDLNHNGEADSDEPILGPDDALIPAVDPADGLAKVWLVLKQFAPVAAPLDARNTVKIAASFVYAHRVDLPVDVQTRQDLTITGVNGAAALDLTKAVDAAEVMPGSLIIYTITYTNRGAEPLKNVAIHDQVPAYTRFKSAEVVDPETSTPTLELPPAFTAVNVTAPAVDATSGAIVWTFTGELAPGGTGQVRFTVQVQSMSP